MAKEQFDKSLLKLYHPEEVHGKIDHFKGDWQYVEEDNSFMHKTGLKFFIERDEKDGRRRVFLHEDNLAGWKRHMNETFGLTLKEMTVYKDRLNQEFVAFLGWYAEQLKQKADNMEINAQMLPYLIKQSVEKGYKS